ncbi:hypothetical protein WJX81_002075 [Elliptochloris bilobata]|uniref:4-alpha-glucanotransferase n=1 Tax=Elliptochloris bilobata TaxID=381761 RepID=A0AAW1RTE3_9CHLO
MSLKHGNRAAWDCSMPQWALKSTWFALAAPRLSIARCGAASRTQPLLQAQRRACSRGAHMAAQSGASMGCDETPAQARLMDDYRGKAVGEALGKEYDSVTAGKPKHRRAGVILHPTSLPGPYGIGEIGEHAYAFVEWLQSAGMQAWQVLPLVPPEEAFWSPYTGLDALCGNTLLIALDALVDAGFLDKADLPPKRPIADVDFPHVLEERSPLLRKAADRVRVSKAAREGMERWRAAHSWVEDSALFYCLTHYDADLEGVAWWEWPEPLRFREADALAKARAAYHDDIERFIALQWIFDDQWKALKACANEAGIQLVGDMPIYVGGQSADVWAHQRLFELGPDGAPQFVSGVPPDAFSETGQLWGSPLYEWRAQKADGYKWWVQRISRSLELYDETRIDHFRGFAGYWAVGAKEETAMNGVWKKGPAGDLFQALEQALGHVPIIAEDLGVITPDVVALREAIGAPGMVVLQFAWGSDADNVHLPHNHYENSVCYPGTHDNETAVGWWRGSAGRQDRGALADYLGSDGSDVAWDLIRASFASVSRTAIVMMQDIMRLDNSARMNLPGQAGGNWAWRMGGPKVWERLAPEADALRAMAETYGRLAPRAAAADEEAEELEGAIPVAAE